MDLSQVLKLINLGEFDGDLPFLASEIKNRQDLLDVSLRPPITVGARIELDGCFITWLDGKPATVVAFDSEVTTLDFDILHARGQSPQGEYYKGFKCPTKHVRTLKPNRGDPMLYDEES